MFLYDMCKSLVLSIIGCCNADFACVPKSEGYPQFNWSHESSARHDSLLITSWRGHAARVSFFIIDAFYSIYLLVLFSKVLLNKSSRYAKSRMGMRKKSK